MLQPAVADMVRPPVAGVDLGDPRPHAATVAAARAIEARRLRRLRGDGAAGLRGLLAALALAGRCRRKLARQLDELDRRAALLGAGGAAGRQIEALRWRRYLLVQKLTATDGQLGELVGLVEDLAS